MAGIACVNVVEIRKKIKFKGQKFLIYIKKF